MAAKMTEHRKVVLAYAANGLTDAQIAHERAVAPTTIKTTMRGICKALGVHNRIQAIVAGLHRGLLEFDEDGTVLPVVPEEAVPAPRPNVRKLQVRRSAPAQPVEAPQSARRTIHVLPGGKVELRPAK